MYYYVVNYKSNHTYIHIPREGTFWLVSKLCNSVVAQCNYWFIDIYPRRLMIAQMIILGDHNKSKSQLLLPWINISMTN